MRDAGLIQSALFAIGRKPGQKHASYFYFNQIPDYLYEGAFTVPLAKLNYWAYNCIGFQVGKKQIAVTGFSVGFDSQLTGLYFSPGMGLQFYRAINQTLQKFGYKIPLPINFTESFFPCSLIDDLPNITIFSTTFYMDIMPSQYVTNLQFNCTINAIYYSTANGVY